MQIKRFEAKTMTAALKMVKDEFGINAVILSARTLRPSRGIFALGRTVGVEVTAANDSGGLYYLGTPPIESERSQPSAPSPATLRPARRGLLQSLNHGLRTLAQRRSTIALTGETASHAGALARLHHHLLSQEVARGLAGDMIAHIQRQPEFDPLLGTDDLRPLAVAALRDLGLRSTVTAPEGGTPRVLVVVGPAGAGKTTLAIKLAAAKAAQPGRQVALLTLDDQRIGSIAQARLFGALLKIPVKVATSAAAVRLARETFDDMDWLIVDSPGVSPTEPHRPEELRQMLEPLTPKEVHLVLNACVCEKDLARMIDGWKGFSVDRLVFTHLDEAGLCGHLLNLLARTGLPLSYLSTGPHIPEDLAEPDLSLLLRRIWPAPDNGRAGRNREPRGVPTEATLPERLRLVANGNSELYHRPDCKWVRKIKPEHLIHFDSAADAEARHFIACRNCRPQRADGIDAGDVLWNPARTAGGR
jgi:flagellar biosynthesis protein FlhF